MLPELYQVQYWNSRSAVRYPVLNTSTALVATAVWSYACAMRCPGLKYGELLPGGHARAVRKLVGLGADVN
eukprot:203689-Rhodomonas_salina.2